jgi:hypothetical protein
MSTLVRGPPSLLFNKYCSSFHWLMRLEHNVDHSPPSSAEVKSECRYTSIPNIHVHGMYTNNFSFFTCAIIIKSDYSSLAVDVLYPSCSSGHGGQLQLQKGKKRWQSCLLFPPVSCDWTNSHTSSYITNTLPSTITFQHPSEPINLPWR